MRSRTRSALRSALCAAALAPALLVPAPALANDGTAFLGFEGNKAEDASALTDALRAELERRGKIGDKQMSLVELRLTMGCEQGDDDCVIEGGKTMEAEAVVYGTVSAADNGYLVETHALDVNTGEIQGRASESVVSSGLEGEAATALAKKLVDGMFGAEAGGDPEVPAAGPGPVSVGGEPATATGDEPAGPEVSDSPKGKVVWGAHKPVAKWKVAGLGVSAGLTVASLGTAIATTVMIGPNGPLRKDLLDAANRSLTDSNLNNDVDPNTSDDLCQSASEMPSPGEVVNLEMHNVCTRADRLSTVATATWITTGIFGAATVAFTVLMFAHRQEPGVAAMRRRNLQLGGAPTRGGGFVVGGRFDF